MVFGPKFHAFRIVLYITIIVTIIVILIDPSGVRTRALEQNTVSGSPWLGRWFSLAVLFLLYFICIAGQGHLAWVTFVFVVLITAIIVLSFNFIIPQINKAKNPEFSLETEILLNLDGDGCYSGNFATSTNFSSPRKFVTPIYY